MSYTIKHGRPEDFSSRIAKEVQCYDILDSLHIDYYRIDHEPLFTMDSLKEVKALLDTKVNKNLFLCNRQETDFYLLLMPGNKPFKTKELSPQLNCSRLSFGSEDNLLKLLNLTPGSCSILSLINDKENKVQLLIDKDLLEDEFWACHPCINTSTLRFKKEDILNVFLPSIHHQPIFVELKGE